MDARRGAEYLDGGNPSARNAMPATLERSRGTSRHAVAALRQVRSGATGRIASHAGRDRADRRPFGTSLPQSLVRHCRQVIDPHWRCTPLGLPCSMYHATCQ